MQTELSQCFDEIEKLRATIQKMMLGLDERQQCWSPHADAWSAIQVIEHLVLCDETIGRAHPVGVLKTEMPMFRVLPRAWRRFLILSAMNRSIILPLPSRDVEPQGNVSLATLLSRWETTRRAMRYEMEPMRSRERRYCHPVMGPLTARQLLELEQVHMAYHLRQIEALQSHPDFPKVPKE